MTKEFLNKSEINIDAAKELHSIYKYYCSSIHCSYYSCVQMMLHLIYDKMGYDRLKLEKEYSSVRKSSTIGLHEFYINKITLYLAAQKATASNRNDRRLFEKEIMTLKKSRTSADYYNVYTGEEDSRHSRNRAVEINKVLKKLL